MPRDHLARKIVGIQATIPVAYILGIRPAIARLIRSGFTALGCQNDPSIRGMVTMFT